MAPEGRKVGSLKRRVRSHVVRWEMKNCTPLWHEAHFEVKMYKALQLWSTFRSCDVEKVHQNLQNTKCTRHIWTLKRCFAWHAQAIVQVAKSEQNVSKCEGFVAFPQTMAGVGHLKRICKDAFSVAGAVQETCSSELLGVRALIS